MQELFKGKMQIDFPCICGHSKEIHSPQAFKGRQYSPDTYLLTACYYEINDGLCVCREYKQDNLRYLEQLSETL